VVVLADMAQQRHGEPPAFGDDVWAACRVPCRLIAGRPPRRTGGENDH
jgi:hypothetical protein